MTVEEVEQGKQLVAEEVSTERTVPVVQQNRGFRDTHSIFGATEKQKQKFTFQNSGY